jgi:hypothetical protein
LWFGLGGAVAVLVIAGGLVFALTRSDPNEAAEPEPTTTTTTTTIPLPVWPLTGLPDAKAGGPPHPAIVVKMDNSPDARPQTGINEADIVYEVLVEGITRYALVFHSNLVDPVGPVRSARSSDINLVANLSTPLFSWSGANGGVIGEVALAARKGILIDASYDAAEPAYFRSSERRAPHNLYVHLPQLLELKGPESPANPSPIFTYQTGHHRSVDNDIIIVHDNEKEVRHHDHDTSAHNDDHHCTPRCPGARVHPQLRRCRR